MTDEEIKAIKEIERELTDEDRKEYMSKWFALDLKILLNLIQKQKEEIEKKNRQLKERTNRINNLEKECQKYFEQGINKDKIIDDAIIEIEKLRQYFSEDLQPDFIRILEILKDKKVIDW